MENGKESAYPSEKLVDSGHPMLDSVKVKTKGITKLEYFAGLAMQGVLAEGITSSSMVAPLAVGYAKALLKELEKNESK